MIQVLDKAWDDNGYAPSICWDRFYIVSRDGERLITSDMCSGVQEYESGRWSGWAGTYIPADGERVFRRWHRDWSTSSGIDAGQERVWPAK
jgi:hypothetical protein